MSTVTQRFIGPVLILSCIIILFHCSLNAVSAQPSGTATDTVEVLQQKIRFLEERLRILESQMQKVLDGQTGTDKNMDAASLEVQMTDLSDEIESLKLSLEEQEERMARVKISGEERIRFMTIDTHGAQAVGAYGEELKEESTLKHYMRLETRVAISDNLLAGARLRLSNVSKSVLDEGPEYLSQEWGSAFLRYARKEFNCTMGVYDIHFTPFTLMRWDQEDNPEGGGEAGGGCLPCGGIAGAIPSESLEELSPVLSFEGARLNGMAGDFTDIVAFYARPKLAGSRQYRQHLFGVRTKFLNYHQPSTSFRHVGLTLMTTRDEMNSILLKTAASPPAMENNVLSLDADFPLTEHFLLRGEWTFTEVKLDSVMGGRHDYDGSGFLVGFKLNYPENIKIRCSYLRLDKFFESAYRAVSYMTNRHGVRGALTVEIPEWKASFSAFAKVLKEIDPFESCDCKDELQTFYVGSLGVSVVPVENLLIRPSIIYRGTRRKEGTYLGKIEDNSYLFILELIQTLFKDNEFILRYQYIDSEDKVDPSLDYKAETVFTMFSLKF